MKRTSFFLLLLFSLTCAASAQVDWSWRTPPTIRGLLYADGQFVGVGDYGRVLLSRNGQSWFPQTSSRTGSIGSNWDLFDITCQPGKWVAASRSGKVIVSSDGRAWTEASTSVTSDLYRICSANGTFVAGTSTGSVISSTDGTNWVTRYSSTTDPAIYGVAYGNGRFVTLTQSGSKVHYSADGVTWTNATATGLGSFTTTGMTFGNGLFVVIGQSGAIRTSPDGIAWTVRASTITGNLQQVAFCGGQFAAAATNGIVLTSPDGITWTQHATGSSSVLSNVNFGNGTWVTFTQTSPASPISSRDMATWTIPTRSITGFPNSSAYGNGAFVLVEDGGTIFSSSDGYAWTARTSGTSLALMSVIYGGGQFVATGSSGEIVTSPDGSTWTHRVSTINGNGWPVRGVAYGSGKYVAVYDATGFGQGILTSLNGITWASTAFSAPSTYFEIASNGTSFFATTQAGDGWTSTNGTTWTKVRTAGGGDTCVGIAYGNGVYVICGYGGKIWTTTDGATWTLRSTGTTNDFYGIGFANGNFVAAGTNGLLATSPDGATWTLPPTATGPGATLYGPGGGAGITFAVGRTGETITSRARTGYPYSAWKQDYFPDEEFSSPVSDIESAPAGDGLPNKLKYAFGLAPRDNAAALGLAPTPGTVTSVGELHGFVNFMRSRDAATYLQYRLQSCSALASGSWQFASTLLSIVSSRSNGDLVQLLDQNAAGSTPQFYRLRIDFGTQLTQ